MNKREDVTDQAASESNLDEQTEDVTDQTNPENNLDEPTGEFVGLTDEQISRIFFGDVDNESTSEGVGPIPSKDDDLSEQTNEVNDQINPENNLDEPTGELVGLTNEQISRIFFGDVDNGQTNESADQTNLENNLNESTGEQINRILSGDVDSGQINERGQQETTSSTMKRFKEVIDPSQLREVLRKINSPTIDKQFSANIS